MSNVLDLNPTFFGSLSKKNMLDLPDGTVIMSNVFHDDVTPVLVHEVGTKTRSESWQLIKDRKANGRKAYGFSSWASYRAYYKRLVRGAAYIAA